MLLSQRNNFTYTYLLSEIGSPGLILPMKKRCDVLGIIAIFEGRFHAIIQNLCNSAQKLTKWEQNMLSLHS